MDQGPFDFLELKRIFNHWQSGMHGKGGGRRCSGATTISRASSPVSAMRASIRVVAAKMLASTLHGLQGTPTSIREEIGMTNPGYQHR